MPDNQTNQNIDTNNGVPSFVNNPLYNYLSTTDTAVGLSANIRDIPKFDFAKIPNISTPYQTKFDNVLIPLKDDNGNTIGTEKLGQDFHGIDLATNSEFTNSKGQKFNADDLQIKLSDNLTLSGKDLRNPNSATNAVGFLQQANAQSKIDPSEVYDFNGQKVKGEEIQKIVENPYINGLIEQNNSTDSGNINVALNGNSPDKGRYVVSKDPNIIANTKQLYSDKDGNAITYSANLLPTKFDDYTNSVKSLNGVAGDVYKANIDTYQNIAGKGSEKYTTVQFGQEVKDTNGSSHGTFNDLDWLKGFLYGVGNDNTVVGGDKLLSFKGYAGDTRYVTSDDRKLDIANSKYVGADITEFVGRTLGEVDTALNLVGAALNYQLMPGGNILKPDKDGKLVSQNKVELDKSFNNLAISTNRLLKPIGYGLGLGDSNKQSEEEKKQFTPTSVQILQGGVADTGLKDADWTTQVTAGVVTLGLGEIVKGGEVGIQTAKNAGFIERMAQSYTKIFGETPVAKTPKYLLGEFAKMAADIGTAGFKYVNQTDISSIAKVKIAGGLVDSNLPLLSQLGQAYIQPIKYVYSTTASLLGSAGDTMIQANVNNDTFAGKLLSTIGYSLNQNKQSQIMNNEYGLKIDSSLPRYNGFIERDKDGKLKAEDLKGSFADMLVMSFAPMLGAAVGGNLIGNLERSVANKTGATLNNLGESTSLNLYNALAYQQVNDTPGWSDSKKLQFVMAYSHAEKLGNNLEESLFKKQIEHSIGSLVENQSINEVIRNGIKRNILGGADPSFDMVFQSIKTAEGVTVKDMFKAGTASSKLFGITIGKQMIGEGVSEGIQSLMEGSIDPRGADPLSGNSFVINSGIQGALAGAFMGGIIKLGATAAISVLPNRIASNEFILGKQTISPEKLQEVYINQQNIDNAQYNFDRNINDVFVGNGKNRQKAVSNDEVGVVKDGVAVFNDTYEGMQAKADFENQQKEGLGLSKKRTYNKDSSIESYISPKDGQTTMVQFVDKDNKIRQMNYTNDGQNTINLINLSTDNPLGSNGEFNLNDKSNFVSFQSPDGRLHTGNINTSRLNDDINRGIFNPETDYISAKYVDLTGVVVNQTEENKKLYQTKDVHLKLGENGSITWSESTNKIVPKAEVVSENPKTTPEEKAGNTVDAEVVSKPNGKTKDTTEATTQEKQQKDTTRVVPQSEEITKPSSDKPKEDTKVVQKEVKDTTRVVENPESKSKKQTDVVNKEEKTVGTKKIASDKAKDDLVKSSLDYFEKNKDSINKTEFVTKTGVSFDNETVQRAFNQLDGINDGINSLNDTRKSYLSMFTPYGVNLRVNQNIDFDNKVQGADVLVQELKQYGEYESLTDAVNDFNSYKRQLDDYTDIKHTYEYIVTNIAKNLDSQIAQKYDSFVTNLTDRQKTLPEFNQFTQLQYAKYIQSISDTSTQQDYNEPNVETRSETPTEDRAKAEANRQVETTKEPASGKESNTSSESQNGIENEQSKQELDTKNITETAPKTKFEFIENIKQLAEPTVTGEVNQVAVDLLASGESKLSTLIDEAIKNNGELDLFKEYSPTEKLINDLVSSGKIVKPTQESNSQSLDTAEQNTFDFQTDNTDVLASSLGVPDEQVQKVAEVVKAIEKEKKVDTKEPESNIPTIDSAEIVKAIYEDEKKNQEPVRFKSKGSQYENDIVAQVKAFQYSTLYLYQTHGVIRLDKNSKYQASVQFDYKDNNSLSISLTGTDDYDFKITHNGKTVETKDNYLDDIPNAINQTNDTVSFTSLYNQYNPEKPVSIQDTTRVVQHEEKTQDVVLNEQLQELKNRLTTETEPDKLKYIQRKIQTTTQKIADLNPDTTRVVENNTVEDTFAPKETKSTDEVINNQNTTSDIAKKFNLSDDSAKYTDKVISSYAKKYKLDLDKLKIVDDTFDLSLYKYAIKKGIEQKIYNESYVLRSAEKGIEAINVDFVNKYDSDADFKNYLFETIYNRILDEINGNKKAETIQSKPDTNTLDDIEKQLKALADKRGAKFKYNPVSIQSNNYSPIEKYELQQYIKGISKTVNVDFKQVDESVSKLVSGYYYDNLITIIDGGIDPKSTASHEVIHHVVASLSEKEQVSLFNAVAKEYRADKVYNQYKENPTVNNHRDALEEKLADEFAKWTNNQDSKHPLVKFFERIMDFIKKLLGQRDNLVTFYTNVKRGRFSNNIAIAKENVKYKLIQDEELRPIMDNFFSIYHELYNTDEEKAFNAMERIEQYFDNPIDILDTYSDWKSKNVTTPAYESTPQAITEQDNTKPETISNQNKSKDSTPNPAQTEPNRPVSSNNETTANTGNTETVSELQTDKRADAESDTQDSSNTKSTKPTVSGTATPTDGRSSYVIVRDRLIDQLNRKIIPTIVKKGVDIRDYNLMVENLFQNIAKTGQIDNGDKEAMSYYYQSSSPVGSNQDSQYFTPTEVVKAVMMLSQKYGYKKNSNQSILEPAAGTGRFLSFTGENDRVDYAEVNPYSTEITKILYPQANQLVSDFNQYKEGFNAIIANPDNYSNIFSSYIYPVTSIESQFDGDTFKLEGKYDFAVGNPPYSDKPYNYRNTGVAGFRRFETYFTAVGLKSLKEGGILLYVIPSKLLNNEFNISEITEIAKLGTLEEAYRLPYQTFNNSNQATRAAQIQTDLVVFKKNTTTDDKEVDRRVQQMTSYFSKNPENILGTIIKVKNRYGDTNEVVNLEGETTAEKQESYYKQLEKIHASAIQGLQDKGLTENQLQQAIADNNPRFIQSNNEIGDYTTRVVELFNTEIKESRKAIEEEDIGKVARTINKIIENPNQKRLTEKDFAVPEFAKPLKKVRGKRLVGWLERPKNFELFSEQEIFNKNNANVDLDVALTEVSSIYDDKNYVNVFVGENENAQNLYENRKLAKFDGQFVTNSSYYSGKVYDKLDKLESDVTTGKIDEAGYNFQKEKLQSFLPKWYYLNSEDPKYEFVLKYSDNNVLPFVGFGDYTDMKQSFRDYISKNSSSLGKGDEEFASKFLGDYNSRAIARFISHYYVEGSTNPYGMSKKDTNEKPELKRQYIREMNLGNDAGQYLFNKYLKEIIPDEARQNIEQRFNKFNATIEQDYGNVPMLAPMSVYKTNSDGSKTELLMRSIQLQTVRKNLLAGSQINALDVGGGKTLAMIATIANSLYLGKVKRPMLLIPGGVYAQFVKELRQMLPQYNILAINGLNKDDLEYLPMKDGELQFGTDTAIPEGTIIVGKHTVLDKVYFNPEMQTELRPIVEEIVGSVSNDKIGSNKEETSDTADKITKVFEKVKTKKDNSEAYLDIGKLGVDMMVVDEAHLLTNVFSTPRIEEVGDSGKIEYKTDQRNQFISGVSSAQVNKKAMAAYLLTQYLNNNKGKVILATATPIENRVQQFYAILSMVAGKFLSRWGIRNLSDFVTQFADMVFELTVRTDGTFGDNPTQVVRNWQQIAQLRGILQQFMIHRSAEQLGVSRPLQIRQFPILKMTAMQMKAMDDIRKVASLKNLLYENEDPEYLKMKVDRARETMNRKGKDINEKTEKPSVNGLRLSTSLDFARMNVSPLLVEKLFNPNLEITPKAFYESSNVVQYTVGVIKKHAEEAEKSKKPMDSTLIYLDLKDGHDIMIETISRYAGISKDEIGSISGDTTEKMRTELKNRFNGLYFDDLGNTYNLDSKEDQEKMNKLGYKFQPRLKVLIGTSVIGEGLDLQNKSNTIIMLTLPWNVTKFRQIIGRIWRPGSKFVTNNILIPVLEKSGILHRLQKLGEKESRERNLFDFRNETNNLTLSEDENEFDNLKIAILDPAENAKIALQDYKDTIKSQKARLDNLVSYNKERNEKLSQEIIARKGFIGQYNGYLSNVKASIKEKPTNDFAKLEVFKEYLESLKELTLNNLEFQNNTNQSHSLRFSFGKFQSSMNQIMAGEKTSELIDKLFEAIETSPDFDLGKIGDNSYIESFIKDSTKQKSAFEAVINNTIAVIDKKIVTDREAGKSVSEAERLLDELKEVKTATVLSGNGVNGLFGVGKGSLVNLLTTNKDSLMSNIKDDNESMESQGLNNISELIANNEKELQENIDKLKAITDKSKALDDSESPESVEFYRTKIEEIRLLKEKEISKFSLDEYINQAYNATNGETLSKQFSSLKSFVDITEKMNNDYNDSLLPEFKLFVQDAINAYAKQGIDEDVINPVFTQMYDYLQTGFTEETNKAQQVKLLDRINDLFNNETESEKHGIKDILNEFRSNLNKDNQKKFDTLFANNVSLEKPDFQKASAGIASIAPIIMSSLPHFMVGMVAMPQIIYTITRPLNKSLFDAAQEVTTDDNKYSLNNLISLSRGYASNVLKFSLNGVQDIKKKYKLSSKENKQAQEVFWFTGGNDPAGKEMPLGYFYNEDLQKKDIIRDFQTFEKGEKRKDGLIFNTLSGIDNYVNEKFVYKNIESEIPELYDFSVISYNNGEKITKEGVFNDNTISQDIKDKINKDIENSNIEKNKDYTQNGFTLAPVRLPERRNEILNKTYSDNVINAAKDLRELSNKTGERLSKDGIVVGNASTFVPISYKLVDTANTDNQLESEENVFGGYAQSTLSQRINKGEITENPFEAFSENIKKNINRIEKKYVIDKFIDSGDIISQKKYNEYAKKYDELIKKETNKEITPEEIVEMKRLENLIGTIDQQGKLAEGNKDKKDRYSQRNIQYNSYVVIDGKNYWLNADLHNRLTDQEIVNSSPNSKLITGKYSNGILGKITDNTMSYISAGRRKLTTIRSPEIHAFDTTSRLLKSAVLNTISGNFENVVQITSLFNTLGHEIASDMLRGKISTIKAISDIGQKKLDNLNEEIYAQIGDIHGVIHEEIDGQSKNIPRSGGDNPKSYDNILNSYNKLISNKYTQLTFTAIIRQAQKMEDSSLKYIRTVTTIAKISEEVAKNGETIQAFNARLDKRNQADLDIIARAIEFAQTVTPLVGAAETQGQGYRLIKTVPIVGNSFAPFMGFLVSSVNVSGKIKDNIAKSVGIGRDKAYYVRHGNAKFNYDLFIKSLVQLLGNLLAGSLLAYYFGVTIADNAQNTNTKGEQNARFLLPFVANKDGSSVDIKDLGRVFGNSPEFIGLGLYESFREKWLHQDSPYNREGLNEQFKSISALFGVASQVAQSSKTNEQIAGGILNSIIPYVKDINKFAAIYNASKGNTNEKTPATTGVQGVVQTALGADLSTAVGLPTNDKLYDVPDNKGKAQQLPKSRDVTSRAEDLLPFGKQNINLDYLQSGITNSEQTLGKEQATLDKQLSQGKVTQQQYDEQKGKLDNKAVVNNLTPSASTSSGGKGSSSKFSKMSFGRSSSSRKTATSSKSQTNAMKSGLKSNAIPKIKSGGSRISKPGLLKVSSGKSSKMGSISTNTPKSLVYKPMSMTKSSGSKAMSMTKSSGNNSIGTINRVKPLKLKKIRMNK